ncbi:hypothetical protein D3C87_1775650 [compost metagenome]
MVDLEARQVLDHFLGALGASKGVGRVDLLGAVLGDQDLGVAGDRDHAQALLLGQHGDEHDRVGAGALVADALALGIVVVVDAEDEDALRAARLLSEGEEAGR